MLLLVILQKNYYTMFDDTSKPVRPLKSVCMKVFGLFSVPISHDRHYATSSSTVSVTVLDCTTVPACCQLQIPLRFAMIHETFGTSFYVGLLCYNVLVTFDTSVLLKYRTIGRLLPNQEDFSNF